MEKLTYYPPKQPTLPGIFVSGDLIAARVMNWSFECSKADEWALNATIQANNEDYPRIVFDRLIFYNVGNNPVLDGMSLTVKWEGGESIGTGFAHPTADAWRIDWQHNAGDEQGKMLDSDCLIDILKGNGNERLFVYRPVVSNSSAHDGSRLTQVCVKIP
ncbi:MAG: hypothetical protein AAGB34_08830 [Planctomycetota bacterium]